MAHDGLTSTQHNRHTSTPQSGTRLASTSLLDRSREWKKVLGDAARGPLIIASEVVAVADSWSDYESEADGMSASGWFKKHLGPGRGISYFQRRDHAVTTLGEASRRNLHHESAVWIVANVPADKLSDVKRIVYHATREQGGIPMTLTQVRALVKKELGALYKPSGYATKLSEALARLERCEKWAKAKGLALPD